MTDRAVSVVAGEDVVVSNLLDRERSTRRDEVAIDLEDRNSKKGTPPQATESGDIRDLRRGADNGPGGLRSMNVSSTAPMVE